MAYDPAAVERAITRPRFRGVDAVRGLAALAVVLYHVGFKVPLSANQLQNYLDEHLSGPPVFAVVVFFLISGFVLYRPFVAARFEQRPPPALLPYAIRRAARIMPGYWLALAVVSIWFGYSYVFRPAGFVRYFLFLQLYGNAHTLNGGLGVAWTLCVEVTFYAALPLLALAARRLGGRRGILASELTLLGTMLACALVWQLAIGTLVPYPSHGWWINLLSTLPGSLDLFAAGMLLAVLSVEWEHRPSPRRSLALANRHPLLVWLAAAAVFYLQGRVSPQLTPAAWWLLTHALKLCAATLLLAPLTLGPQRGRVRALLSSPPLLWLGTISYGIYLWHMPILQKLAPVQAPHGLWGTFAEAAAISAAVAALSYYLLERPLQLLASRALRKPDPAPLAGAEVP